MDKQKIKSVPRLTTNNPGNNFQTALNFTDVSEDGWVWLRQPEIALTEYARQLVKGHGSSIDLNCNDMELSESLTDHLFDDPKQSIDGLILRSGFRRPRLRATAGKSSSAWPRTRAQRSPGWLWRQQRT